MPFYDTTHARTVDLLMAAVATLTAAPAAPDHYRAYFAWRLERDLPGVRSRYAAFAKACEAAAAGLGGRHFAELGLEERRRCLKSLRHGGTAWLETAVRQEILALFGRTDALLALGYDDWPGRPRGFEGLDRPPQRGRREARPDSAGGSADIS